MSCLPPMTGYTMFLFNKWKEHRAKGELSEDAEADIFHQIDKEWKDTPEAARQGHRKLAEDSRSHLVSVTPAFQLPLPSALEVAKTVMKGREAISSKGGKKATKKDKEGGEGEEDGEGEGDKQERGGVDIFSADCLEFLVECNPERTTYELWLAAKKKWTSLPKPVKARFNRQAEQIKSEEQGDQHQEARANAGRPKARQGKGKGQAKKRRGGGDSEDEYMDTDDDDDDEAAYGCEADEERPDKDARMKAMADKFKHNKAKNKEERERITREQKEPQKDKEKEQKAKAAKQKEEAAAAAAAVESKQDDDAGTDKVGGGVKREAAGQAEGGGGGAEGAASKMGEDDDDDDPESPIKKRGRIKRRPRTVGDDDE
ncbi:unnamed protein product [Vitrella brassicaformis CCMP3155]|uniref:Uncharacterized protein n=1 Tax=Vitrella brassicaformis (strain CCMP3155) TaxID=1169540 RepID=A0A0G4EJ80_VITBC|nr:unnamed protein product [Vitrella brassicaformis CCMP3155]|eukprot:CEL95965.1 unnamed protein product [Vitrella brassicaformis CCMP3155]